jgi:transcriptional regulator with XRE-family HTH domain
MDQDLRQRREALGLSRQQLAQGARCSLTTLQMLESGYRPERSRALDRVLAVLEGHEAAANQISANADVVDRRAA